MDLEQIKNDYAVSKGFRDYHELTLMFNYMNIFDVQRHINDVMKIYARECLKLASYKLDKSCFRTKSDQVYTIELIQNENNIIK